MALQGSATRVARKRPWMTGSIRGTPVVTSLSRRWEGLGENTDVLPRPSPSLPGLSRRADPCSVPRDPTGHRMRDEPGVPTHIHEPTDLRSLAGDGIAP